MFERRSDLVRFLAVVETGGLGRAAEHLDMTQPALSRVLARLFERTTTGMRPTVVGVALAEPARCILREFGTAEETAEAAPGRCASRQAPCGSTPSCRLPSPVSATRSPASSSVSTPPPVPRGCAWMRPASPVLKPLRFLLAYVSRSERLRLRRYTGAGHPLKRSTSRAPRARYRDATGPTWQTGSVASTHRLTADRQRTLQLTNRTHQTGSPPTATEEDLPCLTL